MINDTGPKRGGSRLKLRWEPRPGMGNALSLHRGYPEHFHKTRCTQREPRVARGEVTRGEVTRGEVARGEVAFAVLRR